MNMHITGSRDLNLIKKVVRISPYGNGDESHASLPPFEQPDIALNNITITDIDVEDILSVT